MSERRALDVTIMGREVRVMCPVGEESSLLQAAEYLDRKMHEVRDAGKVIGIDRIAIMAALNIAHELLTTEVSGGGFDIGTYRRRIGAMQEVIDQALLEQNRLF